MHLNRAVKYKKKKKKKYIYLNCVIIIFKRKRNSEKPENSETGQKQKYTLPNHRRGRLF